MLFGDKSKFAIEVFDKEVLGERLFAYILLWVGNDDLGDREQKVMISIPFDHYKDTLRLNFRSSVCHGFTVEEAWEYLKRNSFGDGDGSTLHHNICSNFSESFDGESLYIMSDKESERYIWKKYNTIKAKEIFLPVGTYKEVILAFTQWFVKENK